jgi:Gluconate 2-dehydrogenase subunit 3
LQRRELLKYLAMGSTLAAMPASARAAFRAIHAGFSSQPQLKILNPHQDAAVTAMAELIIPATETPGAKGVRVNEFIDLIVAEWYSEEERAQFFAGLADLDAQTNRLFAKGFVDATVVQQTDILHVLGDQLEKEIAALIAGPRGYRGASPEPDGNFYLMFRNLVLTGYFTSEIGAIQQLHEEIIPGHYDGCVPFETDASVKGS